MRLRIPAGSGLQEPRIGATVALQWNATDARIFEVAS